MMTKTKKLKDLKVRECQYICQKTDMEITCNKCPLHIEINNTQKIIGCYYLIKMIVEEKGEETITL